MLAQRNIYEIKFTYSISSFQTWRRFCSWTRSTSSSMNAILLGRVSSRHRRRHRGVTVPAKPTSASTAVRRRSRGQLLKCCSRSPSLAPVSTWQTWLPSESTVRWNYISCRLKKNPPGLGLINRSMKALILHSSTRNINAIIVRIKHATISDRQTHAINMING